MTMKKGVSNFLLGFLAGAAAGAIAGILFAPDKGTQTRKNLKNKVRELSDEYGLGISEIIDELGMKKEEKAEKPPVARKKRKYTRKTKPTNNQA